MHPKHGEGWKQEEPAMEASKNRQTLKENLDKMMTLKPKVGTFFSYTPGRTENHLHFRKRLRKI